MTQSTGRRVAVIGAGPAGLFCVQALLRVPDVVGIDVFEMLPTPYGLVRYGVAADHAKTKSVIRAFQRDLTNERVRFVGNVMIGRDLDRAELLAHYDAVVYSTGAKQDRSMGIPGELLAGSQGAAGFVSWYSGHPDARDAGAVLGAQAAAVVGAGNVALDVTRILAKSADELTSTDMPDAVIQGLRASQVRDIHVLSRRGPAHAKFTPVELRELGTLANADVVVAPADLVLDAESVEIAGQSRDVTTNLKLLTEWAERRLEGRRRRITFHFWTTPLELHGEGRVDELLVRRQAPGEQAVESVLPVGIVLRAIGYRPEPVPGVPYDEQRGVVPNVSGRVLAPDGAPLPGEYVAGWLKRGPSGVIGTNRADALETVTALAEDLPALAQRSGGAGLPPRLTAAGAQVVDWAAWKRLEAHEEQLGGPRAAASVKLADRVEMLDVCSREPVAAEG